MVAEESITVAVENEGVDEDQANLRNLTAFFPAVGVIINSLNHIVVRLRLSRSIGDSRDSWRIKQEDLR